MPRARPWRVRIFVMRTYLGQEDEEGLQEEVRAVLLLHGLRLVLEVNEPLLELVPHREVVCVVDSHENIEDEDENLQVDQGRQEDFLEVQHSFGGAGQLQAFGIPHECQHYRERSYRQSQHEQVEG